MRELSLFSGAGGGLLGTKLLGWEAIGYVEFNDYCQRVIKQRIDDGILDNAPIFGDIRTFISEGYAESYLGMVDVITAGFPCQPFSVAGKQKGEDDERNMWPATIECIRRIRPPFLLLENVPGLLVSGYYGTILGNLDTAGYDTRWMCLSAKDCGAPHRRERLWIYGSNTNSVRWERQRNSSRMAWDRSEFEGLVQNTLRSELSTRTRSGISDGISNRVDRLRATGNGQVPAVVAKAWELLSETH